ncbi:MAG: hypothetical protein CO164_09530 [Rhodocyclales bacterium CG_4_9_14_3_um_filter_68_10]|nr:MAG: hypothetical protein COZ38_02520 [Rhodocyclales bacterium CG_4_10_14_3_um_filter_68_10]PJA57141.1 MAG: hypothetical protein CO164_09530 [Rhodocyclales bacterium CG_4_9_14_3_um_filter_68_10]
MSAAAPPGRAARILLVTTSYPDGDEGAAAAGSFVRDFARALALRAAVTVVAPGAADRSGLEDGVRVRRFRAPRRPLSLLSPANPAHWPAILGTLHAGGRAVTESCAEGGITHILALWALPSGAWARRAARRHGVPYSIWALGSDIWTLGRIPLVRSLLRRVLRGAEHRLADGHGLCEDVAGIAGMSCAFLPSCRDLGVRELRARRAGPPYRLAFLGRWHPNKGIDLLLDALLRLEGPDWARVEEVRVFGGGPLHERVGEGIRALAARGRRVTAGGYLDRDGARALLAWADYLVIPSRIESIPVIFSDAMQAGCPVIATPVGDLPRLVAELRCGILAAEPGAEALAVAIREALAQPPERFGARLAQAARLFDVRTVANSFLDAVRPDPGKPA